MPQSDLLVRIGADVSRLTSGVNKALKDLNKFSRKAERLGSDLTQRVTAPIVAIGAASVATFAKFDKLEKGLAAITGSAAEGARQLDAYLDVVKDTRTTLDLETAVGAALKLQAVGISAQEAEKTIRQLGIAATVSGSSIEDVGGVVRQFSQIIGKGKIEQEDLNTILDRMPALASVIREEFGATTAEQIRDTGISMEEFVGRLTGAVEANQNFQNVQGGISKAIETFGIELQIAGKELGATIAEVLNLEEVIKTVSEAIGSAVRAFNNLNPATQKAIIVTAGLAAAIGPLSFGLGALAKTIPLIVSGLGLMVAPVKSLTSLTGRLGTSLASGFSAFARGGAVQKAVVVGGALDKVIGLLKVGIGALFSPVTLVVGGIALLVAAIVRAYDRSESFRRAVAPLINLFTSLADVVSNIASAAFEEFGGVTGVLGTAFDGLLAAVASVVSFVATSLKTAFDFAISQFLVLHKIITGDLSGAFEELTNGLGNLRDNVVKIGKETVGTFRETLQSEVKANNGFQDIFGINQPIELPVGIVAPDQVDAPEPTKGIVDQEQVDFLQKYNEGITVLNNKLAVFGDSFDIVGEKNKFFTEQLSNALEQGFSPTSAAVTRVRRDLEGLRAGFGNVAVAAIDTKLEENLGLNAFVAQASLATKATDEFNQRLKDIEINAPTPNVFAGLSEAFDVIDEKSRVFGESFDGLSAKISEVKTSINDALENGFTPYSTEVELLQEKLVDLSEQQQAQIDQQTAMKENMELLGEVTGTAFDQVTQAMAAGATAAQAMSRAVVSAVRDAIREELRLAVVAQARQVLQGVPFPINVGLAAAAGAGVSALFNTLLQSLNIPLLAEGGLVNSATLAVIGEAGPEVVVPLDRMREFQNNGGGNMRVTGTLRAQGGELVAVIEQARSNQYVSR